MKKILTGIFIFINYNCIAQGNMISITSNSPAQLTVCGSAKLFTVNVYNPSPFLITSDTLLITLPTGIQYVSGSLVGGVFINAFGGIIKAVLPNISALTSITITYMAKAQCTAIAFAAGGGIIKNTNRVNYTANNNHTYNSNLTSLYLIKSPFLTISTVTNQSYIGTIGGVFNRCITIVNGGLGELSDFTLTDIHGSGIQITSTDKGTLTNIGLTAKIILSGNDFLTIGDGDSFFETGESIVICETVNIQNCIAASSAFKVFWGCGVNACQSSTSSANVLFPNYLPVLVITPIASMNSCLGSGNASLQQLKIINKGLGNALNVQLEIFQATGGGYNANVGSNIDPNSFTIQTGLYSSPSSISPTSTVATSDLGCMTGAKGKAFITIPIINTGDTIYLKWNSYSCCPNFCTNTGQNYINGWRYKGTYKNICQNTYIIAETWGRVYSQLYGVLANDDSPSTLTNGQTGVFNFLFTNYTNSFSFEPGAYWKFEFTLPTFPCLNYSNIRIVNLNGITTWTPNSLTSAGNTVTAIFNSPPPFNLNQAEVKINLSLNCSLCSGIDTLSAVTVKSFYIPNNTCACEIGVSCTSAPFNIICPDPCPFGIFFNNYKIKRTSYGLPDNQVNGGDGLPDGTGSLDFTKIKTTRAMFGDTITAAFTGIVNTNFLHPTLQYCYAYSSISNGNLLTFLDAQLFIYRGGVLLATCNNFAPTSITTGSTKTFLYNLSAPDLINSGCLPVGYINTNADSLIFKPRYKVTKNTNGPILNCFSTNKFYSSEIPNPTSASDKYQCGNYNGNVSVIGYFYLSHGPDSYVFNSCGNRTVAQSYYLSIGPHDNNYSGGNLFPFEYRNWAHPDILTAKIPAGYNFVSARFNQQRTAGTTFTNTCSWQTITPLNPNSDTLIFNVEPYFLGYGGSIPLSDDGFMGNLEVVIQPSCEVIPLVSEDIQYDWTFEPNTYLTGLGSDTCFLSATDEIIYEPPFLFLQSVLPSVFALDSTTTWDISISNTSNISDAVNTWLSGPMITGVSITKVVDLDSNITIPISGNIFQVGTVEASAVRNFRITASFISCGPDSIIVYTGWNCSAGYPLNINDYPCVSKKITLTLTPLSAGFLMNSTAPATSIELCDTAEFSAEGINVFLGTAYALSLQATLPNGISILNGSSQLNYPVSDTSINIPDPSFMGANVWKWDISQIDSLIGADGLKGILDTILNSFKITFKTITDCGYISGSSISYIIKGATACGLAVTSEIFLSPPLTITGATEQYATDITLKTTYLSPCAENITMRVFVINEGPSAFGQTDSIQIEMPVGVEYISGSFIGLYNSPINGTPVQYSLNGNSYLVWKLPLGTSAGDSSIFTFQYTGQPSLLSCGIVFFEAETYCINTISCLTTGIDCITKTVTGDTSLPVFTYKAYLSLSNGNGSAIPNPPGGELVTLSYDITNTGQAILSSADSIVQFFSDDNGDGIYNTGDQFLAEDTLLIPKDSTMRFTSTFYVPSGKACSIIAVIDPLINFCVCDYSELLINLNLISLFNDSTLCAEKTIILSTAPVNGYTYNWTPSINLNDPNISNATLTTSNTTSTPISTSYILSTNRINCISKDTISITANPLPTGNILGSLDICASSATSNITLIGSGSIAPYIFTYNINGGANQTVISSNGDTAIVIAPTNLPGIYVYNLINIEDSSSTNCSQVLNDSATIIVNPYPVASISIDGLAEACVGEVSPNILFAGSIGTAPFTFTYTINGGPALTITTTSDSSVLLAVSTNIAGTFIYELLSVQDASSTTCSQVQNGSTTVTINPLPTAIIEGGTEVCKDATEPIIYLIGFTGISPYTFTYNINGGINQTIISTNGDSAFIYAPTLAAGSFTYNLISVMDSSTTNCEMAQSGSTTVIIDPLPTGTIDGTAFVCQNYYSPMITLIGYGGVAPYTFTYSINGIIQPAINSILGDSVTIAAPTDTAGVFTYTLISVKDANIATCTNPQAGDVLITVNPKPVANFSSTKVCNGNATVFTDSSTTLSGTITEWLWNMGDGSLSNNLQNPFYIYLNAGLDTVTLNINNNYGCSDTIIKSIEVFYNPIADFNHTDVCFTDSIFFINNSSVDLSTSISSYLWVFGYGGTTSNIINPSHLYPSYGIFNVTLVTNTIDGCSSVANIPINIYDPPNSLFTFNNTCLLDSANFVNISTNPTMGTISSYSWDYGDNSSINTSIWNENHMYPTPGDYIVTLTTQSSNLGCQGIFMDTITVFPMPIADFSFTNICFNQLMYFNDSSSVASGNVTNWEWDFGDLSPVDTNQQPSHNYSNASSFSVSLVAISFEGCKDTVVKNTVVHPLPIIQFSSPNVCDGSVVNFTNLSTIPITDTILSSTWDFNDGSLINTNSNATHIFPGSGSYIVMLTSISYFGCVDSASKTSVINPNPYVSFTSNDSSGCEPLCINFQNTSSIFTGNNNSFLWDFGDGSQTITNENTIYCYANDSVSSTLFYTPQLSVTSDSGCISALSKNNYISVFPKPFANFSVEPKTETIINPIISITNLSAGASFWFWNFGDLDTSSLFTPAPHIFQDTGIFIITLITTSQLGCADTAYQQINIEPDFVFYIPNSFSPNDDDINETFAGKGLYILNYKMQIFDRWGNLIFFSNDIYKAWDGKINNGTEIAQRDVYVYSIIVTDIKNQEHNYKGIVTLLR